MLVYMGYTIDIRIAMIASTTINSISVKARAKWEFLVIDLVAGEPMILIVSRERKRKRTCIRKMLDNTLSSSCM